MRQKVALALAAALMLLASTAQQLEVYPPLPDETRLVRAVVEKVIDGDTAWCRIVENGVEVTHTVRFLMVDTPETVHPDLPVQHWGPEAADFTRQTLEGKEVWLEYDLQKTDHYMRHLCHVWLMDGTLFTLQLVERGYAQNSFYPPNIRYQKFFIAAQQYAKAHDLGIWAEVQEGAMRIFDIIGVKPLQQFTVKTGELDQVYMLGNNGNLWVKRGNEWLQGTMSELVFIINNPNRITIQ